MKKILFILVMALSLQGYSAGISLEELRMQKRFGFGVSAAGPLSMLGMEVDINLNEYFSVGGGIGTGLDYSTAMVKGRYFLLGESVSPYIGIGIARWWSDKTTEAELSPSILNERFLPPASERGEGFNVWMAYPVLGVQFMHPMGLAVFAELQYLVKLIEFTAGTYAGLGMHWYF